MDESKQHLQKCEELNDKKFKIHNAGTKENYNYNALEVLGRGSFGVVYRVECVETKEIFAIKKVLQDRRFKNRELQILKELDHPNVVKYKQSFFTTSETDDLYLNVVMEHVEETLYQVIRKNYKNKSNFPIILLKKYSYQMLKSLNYIHALGVCHRDIKPHNILVDPNSNNLKLCDFGSAKKLIEGDINISYICSRYYRAPELIFGASNYSFSVDTWSVGCVMAELVLLEPLFPGENSTDQIVEIIKILGTPNKEKLKEMNPEYIQYKFPVIKCFTWKQVFNNKNITLDFIDLLSKILVYEPTKRLTPLEAMIHPFFDELREFNENENTDFKKSDEVSIPFEKSLINNYFEFTIEEIDADKNNLIKKLIPHWYKQISSK
jgi:glycogen synthase kinase 3 beta